MVMSVLGRGVPQWRLWVPYGDPLQCCMCFYRDPNYLQPILNPGGYLLLHSGGSTVLLSDKKICTLTTDQLFNLEFQFESSFKLGFQPKFGIQLGFPIPVGIDLGECGYTVEY